MNTFWRKLEEGFWPSKERNSDSIPIRKPGNKIYLLLSHRFSSLEYMPYLTLKNRAMWPKDVQYSIVLWNRLYTENCIASPVYWKLNLSTTSYCFCYRRHHLMGKIWYINTSTLIAESISSKTGLLWPFMLPSFSWCYWENLHNFGLGQSTHTSLFACRGKVSWTLHHCRRDCNQV